ncbi:MAG: hypothetical protein KC613_25880, partial [Myxococcales bacterium]|nr:hypothetical protein [Myxococcales bacterium]
MIRTGWPLLCLQLPLLLTLVGCEARDAVQADPFACSAPGDCAAGFACLVDRCVPEAELACGADGDCPTPWICESGRCEPPRGGRCRPEAGVCAAGFSCVDQRCVADGVCRDDSDCAVGSVCGPAQVCVGCVVDDHCPPGQRCIAEACGDGCRGDRDCRAEQICEANRCQDGCRMDSDCAQGRICEGGACQDGCQGADDCAPGERCELGRCKPGEACSDDGDCPGDLACREGACVPLACEDVSDCPDGVSWGCVEGTCVRGGCQLAGACEVGGIRCVHTPALVCDAGRQRLTWGGLCEEMGEGDDLQCVADTSGPPRQIEALTDCPAGQHCVEGAAGEAACAPRGECDCTGRRDHARCLFDEGRCVLQACRGWQCDQPDCNSRGPWFPFPFAERLEPFEVLADVAGHTVRGERFMDVEWAFPPPDVRKGSQWEGHVHCSTLGEATPGAAQDWRLPTVHELLTLSQRDADAVAPPRPALARTAVGDGLLAVYLTEPPDGRARVRQ